MPTSDAADTSNVPLRSRAAGVLGSAWAATMGALPHVLHHVGPLAGTAVVAGATGTLVFGTVTFLLTVPLLMRVHRRSASWLTPLALLALFIALWAASAFVIGPAIRDRLERRSDPQAEHSTDHEQHEGAQR